MSGYYNRNNRGITKKLGPVTAYADAVLAGYKGTREQWAQDMAKLGQNVTQVAQNTKLTTELAEQTRVNTEQVAKDTADVRRLAEETGDNAVQVANNTAESNRLAAETKQAAAQAKADAEFAGSAADNFRVDTTLSKEGKAAEAKTTGEKFAQLSEEIENKVPQIITQKNLPFTTGEYLNILGEVASAAFTSLSDYIEVENLTGVYACLYNTMVIGIYDSNKTLLSIIRGDGFYEESTPKKYEIDAPKGCKYIRISNNTNILANDEVTIFSGNGLSKTTTEYKPEVTLGEYVLLSTNGSVSTVSFGMLTDYINVSGIIEVYTSLSSVLAVCYYDWNKNFISGFAGVDAETPTWKTIEPPENAAYIRISNDTRYNPDGIIVKMDNQTRIKNAASETSVDGLRNAVGNITPPDANIIPMYDTIICIGDSLTYGQVYTSASTQRQAFKPYGDVLASLCGIQAKTYATPGDTSILWWQRSSTGAFDDHGLYIVFLGTNNGVTDTIDTDCVGSNPDAFAQTLTGQYGRILQTIKNNGDKAILVLPWAGGGDSLDTTQSVIKKFGEKYGFPVIDITFDAMDSYEYHSYPDGTGGNKLHYNDLGYAKMANVIMHKVNSLPLSEQGKIMRTQ